MSVRKLWSRRLRDGAEVEAVLFFDKSLSEATVEITVRTSNGDALAVNIANAVRKALDNSGAVSMDEVYGVVAG
jgi:hypothetical protein